MFTHCRRLYPSECFTLVRVEPSLLFFFFALIRGILNRPQYLLSLLARPNCLSLGDAFLQPEQCALVLFLFAAGLFQLLGEGLTPPLQRFNASIQVGALRAFLQQLVFQPEEDNIVATVWKSSRSYNCTVYFYYLKKKKKSLLTTIPMMCCVKYYFTLKSENYKKNMRSWKIKTRNKEYINTNQHLQ